MKTTEEIVNGVLEAHQRKYEDAFQILDKSPTDEQVEDHLFSLGFSQDCVRRYLNSNNYKQSFNPAWFNVDRQGGHDHMIDALSIGHQAHRAMFGSALGSAQPKKSAITQGKLVINTPTASHLQAVSHAHQAQLQSELLKIHGLNLASTLTDPYRIIRPDAIQPVLNRKDIP